jgi:fido (protein-threonine AMPylation protein)
MNGSLPDGSTPVTPEEEAGLIPSHVSLRRELNELEQTNILEAETWLLTRRRKPDPLDPKFLRNLHRRMFGHVWKWAGDYRRSDRNLGITLLPDQIAIPSAFQAFGPDGRLVDSEQETTVKSLGAALAQQLKKLLV